MSNDFLDRFRGEIPEMSALERFARASAVGDVLKAREQEARRAERADEREGRRMAEAAAERQQLVSRGWTDRELAEQQAQLEAQRQERIAELEAELDRLDPKRRAVRQAERAQMAMEDALARARQVDPAGYMARAVADFDRRQEARRTAQAYAEISR